MTPTCWCYRAIADRAPTASVVEATAATAVLAAAAAAAHIAANGPSTRIQRLNTSEVRHETDTDQPPVE